ncbi:MAG: alpha/beta-type small acid-soluble spore protein [Oscillospiraceae bacterium]|nr:alpha/beta-type small acid-soluble spore protein [Oscillospiraceae bacterium]
MTNNSNNTNNAKAMLDNMKYEVANELGINLKQGYNGDLTSKEAGYVGGYMVKKMIEDVERRNSGR